jgi:hypothetical protein
MKVLAQRVEQRRSVVDLEIAVLAVNRERNFRCIGHFISWGLCRRGSDGSGYRNRCGRRDKQISTGKFQLCLAWHELFHLARWTWARVNAVC